MVRFFTFSLYIITLFTCINLPESIASDKLAISAKIANIRSGPGIKHEILWKAEKFYPVLILNKKGTWYQFKDFENDTGWIHNSLLARIKAAVVIKEKCNIRSGPSTKNKVVFTAGKGVPFRVILRKGNWIKVEHVSGDQGWIYKTLVKLYY